MDKKIYSLSSNIFLILFLWSFCILIVLPLCSYTGAKPIRWFIASAFLVPILIFTYRSSLCIIHILKNQDIKKERVVFLKIFWTIFSTVIISTLLFFINPVLSGISVFLSLLLISLILIKNADILYLSLLRWLKSGKN